MTQELQGHDQIIWSPNTVILGEIFDQSHLCYMMTLNWFSLPARVIFNISGSCITPFNLDMEA